MLVVADVILSSPSSAVVGCWFVDGTAWERQVSYYSLPSFISSKDVRKLVKRLGAAACLP